MRIPQIVKTTARRALSRTGLHVIKSPFSRYQLELYAGSERGKPRFVNLGAGSFRHPLWHNVDMPNEFYANQQDEFISHDFSSRDPLEIESDSVEIFYCSHVIEHLSDASVRHLFAEVYRCLKTGGIFRVTCPDMELHYQAFMRDDHWLWSQPSGWGTTQKEPEQRFLEYFATLLAGKYPQLTSRHLSSAEVRRLAETLPMEAFFDTVIEMLPEDANARLPEGHCNWFTPSKTMAFLRNSGFQDVWESRYLQSVDPKLRSPCLFDGTCAEQSLYVECRK